MFNDIVWIKEKTAKNKAQASSLLFDKCSKGLCCKEGSCAMIALKERTRQEDGSREGDCQKKVCSKTWKIRYKYTLIEEGDQE